VDQSHTVIEGASGAAPGGIARGTVLGGRYEVRRLLGRGGAGVVVLAHDQVLDEDVAVKVLHAEHGVEARWIDRLAKEVRLARQIRHANVCRVFDFGQADGRTFLVMELAAAGSLRDEIGRDPGARTLEMRLADARAVAEGLAAVHAAGIVHRDVTPQNVLRMGDGRLVVSDFGLATDTDPTTSSIHGGTVAYMAPEIARGEHASVASDVWALGVIVHEIVLGRRPAWRQGRFGSTITPGPNRALERDERRIVEICQRCTSERGRLRPTAAEVAALLASGGAAPPRRARRGVLWLALAAAVVALATRNLPHPRPAAASSLAVPIIGDAEDWTGSARVLARVEGRIQAVTALPGGARVRVSWGDPRRVEDVDLATGARTLAVLPIGPERAGPPVLSPDGAAIAVEGYGGGRPSIFLGPAAPDAHLVAVTAAADPSLASEPRWLAGSRAFVYDADVRNVGVFSLDTNRATILPGFDARPSFTTFKAAVGDRILVLRMALDGGSQIGIFMWPAMELATRFDLPVGVIDWQSRDGARLYGLASEQNRDADVIALELPSRQARRLGRIPGERLGALALAGGELVFASWRYSGDLWIGDGAGRVVTRDLGGREVARDGDRVLVSVMRAGQGRIVELDAQGHERGVLTTGPRDDAPSILPGGRAWTFVRKVGDGPGFYLCAFGGACRRLTDTIMPYATVSPDGALVAYVDPAPQGARAHLVTFTGGALRDDRDIGDAGSYCRPVWSSARTLWISRRGGGTPEWVEIDVGGTDARPTGRTLRGARDCSDGQPDPAGPTRDGAKIVVDWSSELRAHAVP
jgi:Protein kinase domain